MVEGRFEKIGEGRRRAVVVMVVVVGDCDLVGACDVE